MQRLFINTVYAFKALAYTMINLGHFCQA